MNASEIFSTIIYYVLLVVITGVIYCCPALIIRFLIFKKPIKYKNAYLEAFALWGVIRILCVLLGIFSSESHGAILWVIVIEKILKYKGKNEELCENEEATIGKNINSVKTKKTNSINKKYNTKLQCPYCNKTNTILNNNILYCKDCDESFAIKKVKNKNEEDIKHVIKNITKIKNGGTAKLSFSQIAICILNKSQAYKNLSAEEYKEFNDAFNFVSSLNEKYDMNQEIYLEACVSILNIFDKISPCENYLGMPHEEAKLLMEFVRDNNQENQIEDDFENEEGTLNYCTKCGYKIDKDDLFCGHCGNKLK